MSKTITANEVPTVDRLSFLPEYFTPRLMMKAESMFYTQASQICADYKGAYWLFYRLSNGGCYVAPKTDNRFEISVPGNGYEGEVSADAFGVIVTLFVFGALCWIDNEELREKFTNHFHQVRDFAKDHAEAGAIFRAID